MKFSRSFFVTILSLFLVLSTNCIAQQDTLNKLKYSPGFRFKEGLYISHWNLLNNSPIPKSRIITKHNRNNFDFFSKLLSESKVKYIDDYGIKNELNVDELWGFCQKGAVFINWGDDFTRITIIGNVCHFVATFTYEDNYYSNPYDYYNYGYYNSMQNSRTKTERRQYIMLFETGNILEYNHSNILNLIKQDKDLFTEYSKLRKRKQKKMRFLYLRKYNEKHPIYIPLN